MAGRSRRRPDDLWAGWKERIQTAGWRTEGDRRFKSLNDFTLKSPPSVRAPPALQRVHHILICDAVKKLIRGFHNIWGVNFQNVLSLVQKCAVKHTITASNRDFNCWQLLQRHKTFFLLLLADTALRSANYRNTVFLFFSILMWIYTRITAGILPVILRQEKKLLLKD